MGLLMQGKFSEADKKALESDDSYVFSTDGGETGAVSEKGRSGFANAIEFWKLADARKSRELEDIWDKVTADNKYVADKGHQMSVAQVETASKLMDELSLRLNEYFDGERAVKPEKLEFVRQILPNYFIKSEEDADGRREVVLEPMWEFWSAKRFFAAAARLRREVWLD